MSVTAGATGGGGKYVISGAPYVTAGADSTIGASPMCVTAGATGREASYVTAGGAEYVMAVQLHT